MSVTALMRKRLPISIRMVSNEILRNLKTNQGGPGIKSEESIRPGRWSTVWEGTDDPSKPKYPAPRVLCAPCCAASSHFYPWLSWRTLAPFHEAPPNERCTSDEIILRIQLQSEGCSMHKRNCRGRRSQVQTKSTFPCHRIQVA